MDFERMREFHALAQTLNFTQTARDLHISPSALSKHVQGLEAELRVMLVQRGAEGSRSTLTEAGHRFLDWTKPWLEGYDAMLDELRSLGVQADPVRIHGTTTFIIGITSQLRRALEAQGTPIANILCTHQRLTTREALDQGIADFACYYAADTEGGEFGQAGYAGTYGCVALSPERPCFIAAADSAPASGILSCADLERFHVITMADSVYNHWLEANTEAFRAAGCPISVRTVADAPLSGAAFSIGRRELVLSTERFAAYYHDLDVEDVVTLRLTDAEPLVYPFLIWRRDNDSENVRRVVRALECQKG